MSVVISVIEALIMAVAVLGLVHLNISPIDVLKAGYTKLVSFVKH